MTIRRYPDGRLVTRINNIPTTILPSDVGYSELAEQAVLVEPLPEYVRTELELAASVRTERDARIAACDWVTTRHGDEWALGATPTLTDAAYTEWLVYRQALRDITNQEGFPWDGGGEETPWPTQPQN